MTHVAGRLWVLGDARRRANRVNAPCHNRLSAQFTPWKWAVRLKVDPLDQKLLT